MGLLPITSVLSLRGLMLHVFDAEIYLKNLHEILLRDFEEWNSKAILISAKKLVAKFQGYYEWNVCPRKQTTMVKIIAAPYD